MVAVLSSRPSYICLPGSTVWWYGSGPTHIVWGTLYCTALYVVDVKWIEGYRYIHTVRDHPIMSYQSHGSPPYQCFFSQQPVESRLSNHQNTLPSPMGIFILHRPRHLFIQYGTEYVRSTYILRTSGAIQSGGNSLFLFFPFLFRVREQL